MVITEIALFVFSLYSLPATVQEFYFENKDYEEHLYIYHSGIESKIIDTYLDEAQEHVETNVISCYHFRDSIRIADILIDQKLKTRFGPDTNSLSLYTYRPDKRPISYLRSKRSPIFSKDRKWRVVEAVYLEYDQDSKLSQISYYNKDTLWRKLFFTYLPHKDSISEVDVTGKIRSTEVKMYDSSGKLLETSSKKYYPREYSTTINYFYDTSGALVKETILSKDNWRQEIFYENGREVKFTILDDIGRVRETTSFDSKHREIESIRFTEEGDTSSYKRCIYRDSVKGLVLNDSCYEHSRSSSYEGSIVRFYKYNDNSQLFIKGYMINGKAITTDEFNYDVRGNFSETKEYTSQSKLIRTSKYTYFYK